MRKRSFALKDSQIATDNKPQGQRRNVFAAAAVALVGTIALLVGGCTSDPASIVGAGLINNQIDSTLISLDIVTIDAFAGLRVDDDTELLQELPTLYLGSGGGVKASFVANFDFSEIFTEDRPIEDFTDEKINTVKLSLMKYLPYAAVDTVKTFNDVGELISTTLEPTGQPLDLFYFVHELDEPFDNASVTSFPTAVPAHNPAPVNDDYIAPSPGREPFLVLDKTTFLRWIADGTTVGLLVQLGNMSAPGLVGYASEEWTKATELPRVEASTIPEPNIVVDFGDSEGVVLAAHNDVTIFEEIPDVPATQAEAGDGFVLRTGLRSYPAIRYDLSNLPDNARINRAVMSVVNDTSQSFGPTFSVMVSEITAATMDVATGQMDVSALSDSNQVFPLTFRSNLVPDVDYVVEFDVTNGIQRAVNLVNEVPRGFLLSGVEESGIFPFGRRPPDVTKPNYYFRQMNFLGLNDPDPANRPTLKIWYSVIDELNEVGN